MSSRQASQPEGLDNARYDRLVRTLAHELSTVTCAQSPVAEVDVEEWRRAARKAGRLTGLRVRTAIRYGYVIVEANRGRFAPLPPRSACQPVTSTALRTLAGPRAWS